MAKNNTRQELETAIKEANSILQWINNIVKALESDEMTLNDLIAEQESLENRCYELQEKLKQVISLRAWLGFEDIDNGAY